MIRRRRFEIGIAATTWLCCAFFFQGGGWNQNAFFATTVAIVEDGSIDLAKYARSTGDLSHTVDGGMTSAKAISTSLVAVPAYVVARTLTLGVDNHGDRVILRAYLTTVLTSGVALSLLAVVFFWVLRRRLDDGDAVFLALALPLATPLFPTATMLTSQPLALLAAFSCFALLDSWRPGRETLTPRLLFFAGLLAGAAAACEYLMVVLWLPLGGYALWRARSWKLALWFVGGAALPISIPVVHHSVAYGSPFVTGYAVLVSKRMAADAARGFMGFDGFSLGRLFELTFGQIRGFIFLSPFLLGIIPGVARAMRSRGDRAEGVLSGVVAFGILILISSLAYWHSGSAVGSRYALAFVVFAAVPLGHLLPLYRIWLFLGAAVGFAFMLLTTSVTAIPPTPGRLPYENVIRWSWQRFSAGNLASWQQAILVENGVGDGAPTLRFSFNLGQLIGLSGILSLIPLLLLLVGAGFLLRWAFTAGDPEPNG